MSISTDDVKTGGGGLPKTIQPGNTAAKILSVALDQPNFLKEKDGYFIVLELETPKPTEDFEGFLIDQADESKGRYEGQVGRTKSSRWAYQDGKTRSGVEIKRNNEILKFLKNVCEALGEPGMKWWKKVNNKFNTIEEFVDAFNADAPYKDIVLNWCIAGREYHKDNGYTAYDLHLPKFSRSGVPFEAATAQPARVIEFDEDEHIEKAQEKAVDNFSAEEDNGQVTDMSEMPSGGTEDVPEFEI